jgi:hypothetical protein
VDIGKAFTFVTDDPRWVAKILIGAGLALLGTVLIVTVVGALLALAPLFGYLLRLTRNVAAGEPLPLPEWADWGGLFRDGLKYFAVLYGLALPPTLLGVALFIPGIALAAGDDPALAGIGVGLSAGAYCFIFILSIGYSLVLPAAFARLAVTGSLREAFRLRALVAALRANPADYLIILLLTSFVTAFVAYLGLIACLVGVFATIVYALAINHHLYGQAYRRTLARAAP